MPILQTGTRLLVDCLPRVVGVGTATSVVVANMIGTGVFTTSGLMPGCWLAGLSGRAGG